MTQKFYLRDATTSVAGTLPGASSIGTVTATVTVTGATTNRTLSGTIGSAQVSAAATTAAVTTQQRFWFRRFVSDPIAAQTVPGTSATWALHLGMQQSSTSAQFNIGLGPIGVWRPGTGALVGLVRDATGAVGTGFPASTVEVAASVSSSGINTNVVAADGDVLVIEVWGPTVTQSSAMAFTDTVFYGGTTEDSATSNAAYILAPADITMFAAATALPRPMLQVRQAVARSTL